MKLREITPGDIELYRQGWLDREGRERCYIKLRGGMSHLSITEWIDPEDMMVMKEALVQRWITKLGIKLRRNLKLIEEHYAIPEAVQRRPDL